MGKIEHRSRTPLHQAFGKRGLSGADRVSAWADGIDLRIRRPFERGHRGERPGLGVA
ncbi:hypothetical protein [Streptomyces sp. NPDC018045]|uniref:hypothetical protein n=1 Tax=Streptomyces sp. NPDC018045 TaxID=3365037 RepID=UPI0037A498A2